MASFTEARDFLGEANALLDQVEVVLKNPKASPEEKGKVKDMLADVNSLKQQAMEWDQLQSAADEIKRAANEMKNRTAPPPPNDRSGGSASPVSGDSFKDWGEFLGAVQTWAGNMRIDSRIKRFVDNDEKAASKDMSESTGTSGGFLVPTEFQAQLMSVMAGASIIRSRATKISMRRRQIQIPVLNQTQALGAGIPNWFGGLRAYWQEEGSLKTASDPVFNQAVLTAWKLVMLTRASDELLDDSAISLSDFLSGPMGFSGAIAWMEDYAFLQGDGVGKPLGILNSPATLSATRASGGSISYEDLIGMYRRFLPSGSGVWIASQTVMAELLEMVGPSGNPSYLWGGAVAGAPNTLLGLPIVFTEKLPALGTAGDIILADPKYYLIGDRQATTVESTKFEKWEYDQTSWRAVHRVDGRPWLAAPLTYQDATTQVSPFVRLAA